MHARVADHHPQTTFHTVSLGTDVKIRPPPGGASSIKSLMFVLSKAEQFGVPMRLLPHTGGVYGLWLHQAKPTSDQGDDLSLFSSLRGGPATRAMDHWCENSLGGSPFSWLRGGPARAMAGVKIALAAAHFHGFGVARQGPWLTWVNMREKRADGNSILAKSQSLKNRSSTRASAFGSATCVWPSRA